MKRIQTIAAYLVVLALVGVSSIKSAEPGTADGHAIVRTVKGHATYTLPGGQAQPLTVNLDLPPKTSITTGADCYVYLSVNGLSSAVRIAHDTTISLDKMTVTGSGREGVHDTMLNLNVGSIVGQVQKVSKDSTYYIETPHGVAGIRGTDFAVDVVALGNGQYEVTFTSLQGQVVASAVINLQTVTHILNSGESWTVGGNVVPIDIHLYEQLIFEMINAIYGPFLPPPPPGIIIIRPTPSG